MIATIVQWLTIPSHSELFPTASELKFVKEWNSQVIALSKDSKFRATAAKMFKWTRVSSWLPSTSVDCSLTYRFVLGLYAVHIAHRDGFYADFPI